MRDVILAMCRFVAAGVFLTMYLSVWSTRGDPGRAGALRQKFVSELVWVTIPILILMVATIPAVIAVLKQR
jgi:heme/copper-type cytochrome/quinol oxidase subunit 2